MKKKHAASARPGSPPVHVASRQFETLVSVVLPVYNEAGNIEPCLRGLAAALRDLPHEILVCYDSDGDTTLPAIAAMPDRPSTVRLVRNDLGPGVACALQAGFRAARGDVVVTTMADLSDPPEVIVALAREIRAGAAVVSGSRYMKGGSQTGGPWLKRTLSRAAGLSLHYLAGLGTHDATTNFRAYSAAFLREIQVESLRGFEVALELTVKAHLKGLKVSEVPSTWQDRTVGASRFKLRAWLPHYLRWYLLALQRPALRVLLLLLTFALLFTCHSPRGLTQVAATLDGSWAAVLSQAFLDGRAFGTDLVFTYGPYGFVELNMYHPGTFLLAFLVKALCCLALAAGLERLAALRLASFWPRLAWLAVLCAAYAGFFYVAALALLLLYEEEGEKGLSLPSALLGIVLALGSLVKFSYLLAAAVLLLYVTVRDLLGRRWPVLPALCAAAGLALWIAAGQRPGDIFPFLVSSWQVAGGYSEAMALTAADAAGLVAFVVVSLALVGARLCARTNERWWVRGAGALTLGVLLFLVFKGSFVRHDEHAWLAVAIAPVAAVLWLPYLWAAGNRAARVCVLVALVAAAWHSYGKSPFFRLADSLDQAPGNLYDTLRLHLTEAGRRELAGERERALVRVRAGFPFPTPSGDCDFYPNKQAWVLGHGWAYNPRPVFQSYTAYTPALAELNAEHLRGAQAPENVYFMVEPLDNRYPSLDDGPSWPELLTRYDIYAGCPALYWMRRAAAPRTWRLAPLREMTLRFGELAPLPEGQAGPIWAVVDIRPTALDRCANLLYKAPLPALIVNGTQRFRFPPAQGRAGFLLSPLVQSAGDFEALSRGVCVVPVNTFRLGMENPAGEDWSGRLFDNEVKITLWRLEFPLRQPRAKP